MLTDYQLLVTILGPKTGVPPLAAARMQRWSLMLAAYQYAIEYRKSAEHAKADAMSRLVQASLEEQEEEEEVYLISYLEELPVTTRDIAAANRKDPFQLVCTTSLCMDGSKRTMIQCCSLSFHESKNFLLTEAVCCGFTFANS